MDLDTPLTIEGRTRLRKAVVEYESWGYETRHDALQSELGAEQLSKGHVYTLPCLHEGRRHAESRLKESYVLKVCSECAGGNSAHWEQRANAYCFLDAELGVWETAVRRGDDDLLCPILDADRREGWMLMEYCDPASDENLYNDPEAREQNSRTQDIAGRLWERGWLPKSCRDMDVEPMAFDGRLVAIDYEAIYHSDWMYDPLDWHRSPELRRDTLHTAATVLACDEWNAQGTRRPGVWAWRRRAVEKLHYSRVMSRHEAKRLGADMKRESEGYPREEIRRLTAEVECRHGT